MKRLWTVLFIAASVPAALWVDIQIILYIMSLRP